MKLDHQPLAQLSEETLKRDHEFWGKVVMDALGNWLDESTSVNKVAFRGSPLPPWVVGYFEIGCWVN
jgi:hypothetical protein